MNSSVAPRYAGPSLEMEPPFYFEGMTAITFPLRAKTDALQRFCDSYLNIVPEELGYFRPSLPYVFLMMLDYGKMAVQVANLGWFSQREVMFCIPLEWYKRVNGRRVFHDWATISPFIFVDDTLSMDTGRNVYGWPKTMARIVPEQSGWMADPSMSCRASVSTQVFTRAYAGDLTEEQVFLNVRSSSVTASRLPPRPNAAMMPWSILQNAASGLWDLGRDYWTILLNLGLMPPGDLTSVSQWMAMMMRGAEMVARPDGLAVNTLNLKQFRRSDRPVEYCYQALTNGPMRYRTLNQAALLGEASQWAGDLSGGYTIEMIRWPSLRIIETLGLEVSTQVRIGDGVEVARLKPVMPYWYSVDMQYERATNIAWRAGDGVWRDQEGREVWSRSARVPSVDKRFNTTLGAGSLAIPGPFIHEAATSRVLPLLAHKRRAQQYVDELLNDAVKDTAESFQVWGSPEQDGFVYIYLVISECNRVSSARNDLAHWEETELTFYIPVKRLHGGEVCGAGLVPAFTFADGVARVCSNTEIQGVATTLAEFPTPPFDWPPEVAAHDRSSPLFSMKTEILPALGEGAKTQRRTVLQVVRASWPRAGADRKLSRGADDFCRLLKAELRRKNSSEKLCFAAEARPDLPGGAALANEPPDDALDVVRPKLKNAGIVLALDFIANGRDLSIYTLKQIRECDDPQRACFQALTRIAVRFTEVSHMCEIEEPITVELASFASLPIAERLGLIATDVTDSGGAIIHHLVPVRPFLMRYDARQGEGQPLFRRARTGGWFAPRHTDDAHRSPYQAYPLRLTDASYDEERLWKVGSSIEAAGRVVNLAPLIRDWSERQNQRASPAPGDDDARRELGAAAKPQLDVSCNRQMWHARVLEFLQHCDPQTVLELVLSQEWENHHDGARWRTARRKLVASLDEEARAWSGNGRWIAKVVDILKARDDLEQRSAQELEKLRKYEQQVEQIVGLEASFFDLVSPHEDDAKAQQPGGSPFEKLRMYVTRLMERMREVRVAVDAARSSVDELYNASASPDRLALAAEELANRDTSDTAESLNRILQFVLPYVEQQLEHFIDIEAGYARKPSHCIARSLAGADRDRVFPIADCWQGEWYAPEHVWRRADAAEDK